MFSILLWDILLAERLLAGDAAFATAFNFGPLDSEIWPVERIATHLADLWGRGAAWVPEPAASLHEAHFLRLDSSKARAELGWRPRLNTQMALEWTLEWYRACADDT